MAQNLQEYLEDYRRRNPQYRNYNNTALYSKLRTQNVPDLPVWEEYESDRKTTSPTATITDATSPKQMNGIAAMSDYWIDEESAEWMKAAYNYSLTGLSEELITGKARYDLEDYDPSILEEVGSAVLGFFMPLDLLTLGVGGKVAAAGVRWLGLADDGIRIASNKVLGSVGKEGTEYYARTTAGKELTSAARILDHTVYKEATKKGKKEIIKKIRKEARSDAMNKYMIGKVPMYTKAVSSATTLSIYEGAVGGVVEALNPDATTKDIIGGIVGGALGFVTGGPAGAKAGYAIGSSVGGG